MSELLGLFWGALPIYVQWTFITTGIISVSLTLICLLFDYLAVDDPMDDWDDL